MRAGGTVSLVVMGRNGTSSEAPAKPPGGSPLARLLAWARWEFDRPIEVTPAIRLITVERFLKAAVLIAGGLALLVVSGKTDLRRILDDIQNQLNLSSGRSWWVRAYEQIETRIGGLSRRQTDAVAIGAILYGGLEAFEGTGLLLRRRWAEYLVLVATAVFVPVEVEELIRRPTVFKAGALLVNLLIIGYLIWRKRLFLERPGELWADRTESPPVDIRGREGS